MHILVVGLNYRTAPVEIRETLKFDESSLQKAMRSLQNKKSILENVILSTCNRTEIYAVVDQLHTGRYYIKEFLAECFEIQLNEFSPFLFIYEKEDAVEHLYKVTCGLDSMILGETQILGQVRSSFLFAQEEKTTGTVFNYLFKRAVTVAKRAHSETEISANAVSVSYAAVKLAKKIFGSLHDKQVPILGTGKMGELAIRNLHANGATNVTVMNRTFQRAEKLANRFLGEAKALQELENTLIEADILISSTGAKEFVVTKEMMEKVSLLRKGNPLLMVDIAVPRDLDPLIAEIENTFLYDIDDLEGIVVENLQGRKKAVDKIMLLIEEEILLFKQWLATLGVVPVISGLRVKALEIQQETMNSLERKLPHLSQRDIKVLNKHTKSIINQLLKDPIMQAKEIPSRQNAEEALSLFMEIFNLEGPVADRKGSETIEKDCVLVQASI